jgi:hypothetical protein
LLRSSWRVRSGLTARHRNEQLRKARARRMNPCVLDTHVAMVALAILSPVFFSVRTTHRRQDPLRTWRRRRYAKDTVNSTFMSCTRRKGGVERTADAARIQDVE